VPHVGDLGRTLLFFGSQERRNALLRHLLSDEDVWCQGFSETEAGSDLAALHTKALQKPNGRWVIDGHKIWTRDASWADKCLLLARTDPHAPKHKGLSRSSCRCPLPP
jgi:alkylation response protein AidB-like acyl-CoA dehydrogenase